MPENKGMDRLIFDIRNQIESALEAGYKNFIIFPYGDVGIQAKTFLNNAYGIQESMIIDNHLCKYNPKIKALSEVTDLDLSTYAILLTSTNRVIYNELKNSILRLFQPNQIFELDMMTKTRIEDNFKTKIGRYSYGPLCYNHPLIESIGAFCSFAPGSDVVFNHEHQYITTHPMIYHGHNVLDLKDDYSNYSDFSFYFEGVKPHDDKIKKYKRSVIGNDVWLGANVCVLQGVSIGNGVIAGSNAVITKDIPDYAIVVGAPAKIIRFRYSSEQIKMLNKIAWWNWTDEEIRERFDDFYLPIEKFIVKYSSL